MTHITDPTLRARLATHVESYAYQRGRYKGDAPLDPNRRHRSHARVLAEADAVRFHRANILRLTPDGVRLNTDGWSSSPSTSDAIHAGLRLLQINVGIGSRQAFGASQTVLRCAQGTVKFYDGIELNPQGQVLSRLQPFKAWRVDRDKTAALRASLRESGFLELLPMLHATSQSPETNAASWKPFKPEAIRTLCNPEHAHAWPSIVNYLAWDHGWHRPTPGAAWQRSWHKRDYTDTRSRLMKWLTEGMYHTVDTDVTVLP